MDEQTKWLLEGPPWVQYRTRLDLLGQAEQDAEVLAARQAMLSDPQVQEVLTGLAAWPGRVTPESVWKAWAGWEFGQKREPSRWVTLLARRALAQMGG